MIPANEAFVEWLNTEAFIDADAEFVVLEPKEKVTNASGGVVWIDLAPRSTQKMRLIPMSTNASTQERETLDGRFVRPAYVLMGKHDAEMERGDRFNLGDNRYEVVYIQEKRDYQTKGEVVYLGPAS